MSERLPGERAILFTVGVSGMLVPLNSTMIAVALPSITRDLHAQVSDSGWLVTAYLITMASFQPISGKLGDRFGRRPFIVGGVAAFMLASLGAATASSIWVLVVFRAGQAVSGAVVFPNGAALLRELIPAQRRGASFGLLGSSVALGAAIGPPLGGVLIGFGGWPAIFWVNLPLCGAILLTSWRTIPSRQAKPAGSGFDLGGAALLAASLGAGAWLLTRLRDLETTTAAATAAAVVVSAAVFVRHELRHADPVVQPRFFRRRAFSSSNGAIALSNLAMYSLLLAVPLMLHERRGWSDARIGLVLTAMSAGMVVLAPFGGRISDRVGRRAPALAGLGLLSAGTVALATSGQDVSGGALVASLALVGTGLGLANPSIQTSAVEAIEPEHAGMAAATSSTSRYAGSIVGSAVLAGVVASHGGFGVLLGMDAAAAVASALLALGLPGRRHAWDGAPVPAGRGSDVGAPGTGMVSGVQRGEEA